MLKILASHRGDRCQTTERSSLCFCPAAPPQIRWEATVGGLGCECTTRVGSASGGLSVIGPQRPGFSGSGSVRTETTCCSDPTVKCGSASVVGLGLNAIDDVDNIYIYIYITGACKGCLYADLIYYYLLHLHQCDRSTCSDLKSGQSVRCLSRL